MLLSPVTYGPRAYELPPIQGETARATMPVSATQAAGDQRRTAQERTPPDRAAWAESRPQGHEENHGHSPFLAQSFAQKDMPKNAHLQYQQGTAAYLKARDSRVHVLLSDKLVDLRT